MEYCSPIHLRHRIPPGRWGRGGVEDKRRGGACLTALCSEADGAARRWRGWVKERGGGGGAWDWPGWGGWLAGG